MSCQDRCASSPVADKVAVCFVRKLLVSFPAMVTQLQGSLVEGLGMRLCPSGIIVTLGHTNWTHSWQGLVSCSNLTGNKMESQTHCMRSQAILVKPLVWVETVKPPWVETVKPPAATCVNSDMLHEYRVYIVMQLQTVGRLNLTHDQKEPFAIIFSSYSMPSPCITEVVSMLQILKPLIGMFFFFLRKALYSQVVVTCVFVCTYVPSRYYIDIWKTANSFWLCLITKKT